MQADCVRQPLDILKYYVRDRTWGEYTTKGNLDARSGRCLNASILLFVLYDDQDANMLCLLSLNVDALLLILRNISGTDALNISLASKQAYSLASPRIAADLECTSPMKLRKLHQYLLVPGSGGIARVSFLETFMVTSSVFEPEKPDDNNAFDVPYGSGSDFSQVHLLGDILSQAKHIAHLLLDRFHLCMLKDPRIGSSLRAMSHLSRCRLFTVVDGTLTSMHAMQALSLTHLELAYHDADKPFLKNEPKSLPPLLAALSVFLSLHDVELWQFTPSAGLLQNSPMPYPQFPSVRYLCLQWCSEVALDIVQLCPNLSTLAFSLYDSLDRPLHPPPRNRWPPLQRVTLYDKGNTPCVAKHAGCVEQLQVSECFDISHPESTDQKLGLISRASLIGLYLSVKTSIQDAGSQQFWGTLAKQAPRLRSLEIKIEVRKAAVQSGFDETYVWVVD